MQCCMTALDVAAHIPGRAAFLQLCWLTTPPQITQIASLLASSLGRPDAGAASQVLVPALTCWTSALDIASHGPARPTQLAIDLAAHLPQCTQGVVCRPRSPAVGCCPSTHVSLLQRGSAAHCGWADLRHTHHSALLPAMPHKLGCLHAALQCRHSRLGH